MTTVPLIPFDVLFGNPERVGPQLSPDGKRLAFLAPLDGVLNVWVGPADEADLAKFTPVTDDHVRGIRQYLWAFDNTHLLYLQDTGGDENWRIHTVNLDTGEVVDRTPFAGVQAVPLGRSHRKPDEVLIGINKDDPRLHDVYSLRLSTGELTKVVVNPGYDQWLVDHDLDVRGAVEPRADGGIDYLVRDGDGFRKTFSTEPDDTVINVTGFISFTGDDGALWCSSVRGNDTARLVRVDLDTGDETVVAEHPDRDLTYMHAVFHPETFEPQLVSFATDRFEYQVLDESVRADIDAIRGQLSGDVHVISRDRALYALADRGDLRHGSGALLRVAPR